MKVLIQRLRERNELEEKLAKSYKKIHKQKQEIEEQHNNIRDQKTQLEQQNFDLIDLNEEKNHLLSVVVHGLKNPLTSSMCVSELLNNEIDQLSSSHQEYTSLIFKSLRRMSNMINQLLDINVIESKKIKLKLEKIYIKTVIKEVLQNFKLIIQQKNLNIHLELNNPLAKLNRVYLFQIIDNLISNAVKFAPRDTNIYIKLYEKGKHVLIEIRDEGAGIKESELKDIFNRYKRQTEKLNDPEEQAGLRLAIVKKYVDAMQGKVWCESEEGKGACFFVRFNKFIDAPDTL